MRRSELSSILVVRKSQQSGPARKNSIIHVSGGSYLHGKTVLSNSEWLELLAKQMFQLGTPSAEDGRTPTFRSLFAYFVRRQLSGAFTTPEKQATMQQAGDYQVALLFMLGLDWKIASDWQVVRDREKTLTALKKAAGAGAFGTSSARRLISEHN